ncbi:MAG: extracellular solute-binding protein [Phototrophicaceae bacterium]
MSRTRFVVIMTVVAAMLLGTLNSVMAQGNVLVVWADGNRAPIINDLADDVAAQLGIELEVVELGFGDIRDQLLIAGPVGEGPDIFIGAHDWLGQLVSNGAILPLELGALTDEFSQGSLNLFTFNGELYGLPYAQENIALIRNTDLVPEAPTTWADVRAASEALQESGDAQYGFLVQTGDAYHNFPIISGFGGYIFGLNEDGSYNPADVGWNSEGGLAAADWLGGMYSDGLMVPDVNDDVVFQLFEDGDLGMLVTGPWNSSRISEAGVPFSIDPLPVSGVVDGEATGAPFAGGQGFMISAFSENQLLAEIFLTEYVATTDFMQAIFDGDGRPPALLSVDTSADANIAGFVAAGSDAVPMPAIPEMGAVWGAAGNALTLVSQGEVPADAFNIAVDQMVDAIALVQSDERIVGLAGSLQDEAGCDADWDPACEATFMVLGEDGLYTFTVTLPAGDYEYKVAMNGGWDENYGVDGVAGGDNYAISLSEETEVTFTYDDETNLITNSLDS